MERSIVMWRGVIKGRPATKKNSGKIIFVRLGRKQIPKLLPSKTYQQYEELARWQLKRCKPKEPLDWPMRMTALYYLPDRRWWPDLIGLEQATQDILQTCGVITDDRLIVRKDGSHIAGIDAVNPRTEIYLCSLPPDDISYDLDPYVIRKKEAQR